MPKKQLTGQDMFGLLRPEQVHLLSEASETISMDAGSTIFRRGDKATHLHIVLDGEVALRFQRDKGVSVLIDQVGPGAVFGSCVCFELGEYTLTAQCTVDSRILSIASATLKKLMDEDVLLGYTLQTLISRIYFKRYIDTMHKLQAIVQTIPIEAS